MSAIELLHARRHEHEELLRHARALLVEDERVVAAWLFGSRGRLTADALSDTDLWIVIADQRADAVMTECWEFVARLGPPVLTLEVRNNAPARGAYLMVLYPGRAGVHQVDCYWQRQSDASLPQQAEVLFNRGAIPRDARREQLDPPPATAQQPIKRISKLIAWFWAMSNIAVKGTVRRFDVWEAASTIRMLGDILDEVQRFIGVTTPPLGQETWRATLRPATCAREQIAALRAMAREMAALSPQVEALGVSVQSGVIPYVYDFFDLADAVLTEGIRTDEGCA